MKNETVSRVIEGYRFQRSDALQMQCCGTLTDQTLNIHEQYTYVGCIFYIFKQGT